MDKEHKEKGVNSLAEAASAAEDSTVWKQRRGDSPILPALGQRNGDEIR